MEFKNVKLLILEDQELIAENLRRILEELGARKIWIATSTEKAEALINEVDFDLLLIDINLGEGQKMGTELMLEIHEKSPIPHIYITANADERNIKSASATFPEGFLEKPYTQQSIQASISIALKKIDKQKLTVTLNNRKILIDVNDILYLETDSNYVNLFLENGQKCVERISLKQLLGRLPLDFIQIHKSYVINLNKVQHFTSTHVKLNKQELPVGRNYKKQFKDKMEQILR
ncbi:LytR/AlgR family response regulator transcription factor [Brumimicrobium aurantiacum]|uniref:DNA-binding response regulator n=1 Tax=Brumimicrobium aurantiacum TaxID=1737063 RepID=A0A3E1EYU0_9FLAO|nr:response regulator transcription factor [Brumimicrobium aurantiacum]RFC54729.1 DNA-binding response regulator [Brumimicrobium aurantiacum]